MITNYKQYMIEKIKNTMEEVLCKKCKQVWCGYEKSCHNESMF